MPCYCIKGLFDFVSSFFVVVVCLFCLCLFAEVFSLIGGLRTRSTQNGQVFAGHENESEAGICIKNKKKKKNGESVHKYIVLSSAM